MRYENIRVVSPVPSFQREFYILYIVLIMFIQLMIVGYTSNVWFKYTNSCVRMSTVTLYMEVYATTLILCISYYGGWHKILKSHMMRIAMLFLTFVYAWSATVVLSDCKVYQYLNLSSVCVTLLTTMVTIVIMLNGFTAACCVLMWDNEDTMLNSRNA